MEKKKTPFYIVRKSNGRVVYGPVTSFTPRQAIGFYAKIVLKKGYEKNNFMAIPVDQISSDRVEEMDRSEKPKKKVRVSKEERQFFCPYCDCSDPQRLSASHCPHCGQPVERPCQEIFGGVK